MQIEHSKLGFHEAGLNQDVSQTEDGSAEASAGSRRIDVQEMSGLLIGESFQLAQDQHLAITFRQPANRLADAANELAPQQVLAGTQSRRDELPGQKYGGSIRQRQIAIDGPSSGLHM